MFLNFWQMCFGRFIYGFATGVLTCTTPKMVEEIIPAKLMNKGFGMSTSLFINIAIFGCLILGGGMPDESKDLAETKYWMVIYGAQIPLLVISILLFTFVYTEDTIDFCITKGDKEQAIRQIKNVYSAESDEVHYNIW